MSNWIPPGTYDSGGCGGGVCPALTRRIKVGIDIKENGKCFWLMIIFSAIILRQQHLELEI
jgi:hypothetical protein